MRPVRIANVASFTSERTGLLFLQSRCHHPSLFRRSGWRWQATDSISNGKLHKKEHGARRPETPELVRQPMADKAPDISRTDTSADRSVAGTSAPMSKTPMDRELHSMTRQAEVDDSMHSVRSTPEDLGWSAQPDASSASNTHSNLYNEELDTVRGADSESSESTSDQPDDLILEQLNAVQLRYVMPKALTFPRLQLGQDLVPGPNESPDSDDDIGPEFEALDFVDVVTPEHLDQLQTRMKAEGRCLFDPLVPNFLKVEEQLKTDVEAVQNLLGFTPYFLKRVGDIEPFTRTELWRPLALSWTNNIALLNAKHIMDRRRQDLVDSGPVRETIVNIDEVKAKRVAKVLMAPPPKGVEQLNYMMGIWTSPELFPAHGQYQSIALWSNMMLWVLNHHPDAAAQILMATYVPSHTPWHMVAGVLNNLATHHLQHIEKYSSSEMDFFRHTVFHLLQMCDIENPPLTQHTIWLILTRSDLAQTQHFYSLLQSHKSPLTYNSLLHFAYFFGKHGVFELALEVLSQAVEAGASTLGDVFLSVCNHILRFSIVNIDGYHSNSYIVSRILEIGGKMNIVLYNVLMTNAVDSGDMGTALQVYDILAENGIEPDDYTLSILLNGCKRSGDRQLMSNVVRKAEEKVLVSRSAWLATDILHAIYLQHMPAGRDYYKAKSAFDAILPVFQKYFRSDLLFELEIVGGGTGLSLREAERLQLDPPAAAITIMLGAYLRWSHYYDVVDHVFEKFTNRLFGEASEAVCTNKMIELTLSTYAYNIFLYAFSHKKENLRKCTALVHMMSMGLPANRLPTDPKTNKPMIPAKPDVFTFSILLYAFSRHGQIEAAKKVMELMAKRGLEPTYITWSTLIRGLAEAQDVVGVAESVRDMERAGFEMGRTEVDSFRLVYRRDELMKAWGEIKSREQIGERKDPFGGGNGDWGEQRADQHARGTDDGDAGWGDSWADSGENSIAKEQDEGKISGKEEQGGWDGGWVDSWADGGNDALTSMITEQEEWKIKGRKGQSTDLGNSRTPGAEGTLSAEDALSSAIREQEEKKVHHGEGHGNWVDNWANGGGDWADSDREAPSGEVALSGEDALIGEDSLTRAIRELEEKKTKSGEEQFSGWTDSWANDSKSIGIRARKEGKDERKTMDEKEPDACSRFP